MTDPHFFEFNKPYNKFSFSRTDVKEYRLTDLAPIFAWMQSLMSYLWVGNFDGDKMLSRTDNRYITVTGKDFLLSYVPATSAATFTMPADADFIADDLDNFWFTGGVPNVKTAAQLANPMLSRTVVLYDDNVPYHVRAIGLMRSTVVLTDEQREQLAEDFKLWLFYSEII